MKGLALIVAGCTAIFLISCASPPQIKTPLPAGIRNPLPQPELPDPFGAFVGVWAGRWDTTMAPVGQMGFVGVDETMVIENVVPTSNDTYEAYIILSYGHSLSGNPPGFFRTSGVIGQDGVLRLKPFPTGGVTTASISPDRQRLQIEHRSVGRSGLPHIMRGVLWRTALP